MLKPSNCFNGTQLSGRPVDHFVRHFGRNQRPLLQQYIERIRGDLQESRPCLFSKMYVFSGKVQPDKG